MATAPITIQVDADTAKAYAAASTEDQRKMQLLLSLRLQELTAASGKSLGRLMDAISDEAEARGLTPSALESLLHGD